MVAGEWLLQGRGLGLQRGDKKYEQKSGCLIQVICTKRARVYFDTPNILSAGGDSPRPISCHGRILGGDSSLMRRIRRNQHVVVYRFGRVGGDDPPLPVSDQSSLAVMPVLCREIAAHVRSHVDCSKLTQARRYVSRARCRNARFGPSPPGLARETGVPERVSIPCTRLLVKK